MTKDELIARLEAATGPDRELDAAIFAAICPDKVPAPIVESGYGWRFTGQLWWLQTGEDSRSPRKTIAPMPFTASIDAALTLVPVGRSYELTGYTADEQAEFFIWNMDEAGEGIAATAPTPALAIVIAALKAHAHD